MRFRSPLVGFFCVAFALWRTLCHAPLQAQHHPVGTTDRPSTHGMLIMGSRTIYASHLPMFHAPHDYQIILELSFDRAATERYLTDRRSHPDYTVYTIEPETLVLPAMINQPRPFKAALYRGHFERGGTKIASDMTVKINRVVYFAKFPLADTSQANTIVFGNQHEQFAAHRIRMAPDFDQIVQVSLPKDIVAQRSASLVGMLPALPHTPIGVSSNTTTLSLRTRQYPITLLKQLYLEFDDLR